MKTSESEGATAAEIQQLILDLFRHELDVFKITVESKDTSDGMIKVLMATQGHPQHFGMMLLDRRYAKATIVLDARNLIETTMRGQAMRRLSLS